MDMSNKKGVSVVCEKRCTARTHTHTLELLLYAIAVFLEVSVIGLLDASLTVFKHDIMCLDVIRCSMSCIGFVLEYAFHALICGESSVGTIGTIKRS